jgi:2'-5' RNA ligase
MRCFIAIEIDEEIQTALAALQKDLIRGVDIRKGDVKWVHSNAMHLTLKFLGEVRDNQIVEVCNIAKEVAESHNAFDLSIGQVGHFGGDSARVLWVGAGLDCAALLGLQQDLEERLDLAGWPKENRKFSGHLTLCRIRNAAAGFKLARLTEKYKDFDLGAIRCDTITVFESRLTPDGPIYASLSSYKLL